MFGFANAPAANLIVDDGGGLRASGSILAIEKRDGETAWRLTTRNGSTVTSTLSTQTAVMASGVYQVVEVEAEDVGNGTLVCTARVNGRLLTDSNGLHPAFGAHHGRDRDGAGGRREARRRDEQRRVARRLHLRRAGQGAAGRHEHEKSRLLYESEGGDALREVLLEDRSLARGLPLAKVFEACFSPDAWLRYKRMGHREAMPARASSVR
jgi:hypothetical protein